MRFSEVSNILWRERRLLELLVFKFEEERLILAADRDRWLPHATREIEAVLAELRNVELERAVEAQALMEELGLSGTPCLRQLADAAPAPWDRILDDHRSALLDAVREVDEVARASCEILGRGHRAALEALRTAGEIEVVVGGREDSPIHLIDEVT